MSANRNDIADFSYFLAIVRHGNFRRAAVELGVTPSAVSHSLRGLETRLGVRLLNRTNRSITLTAAGEELHNAIVEPFARIDRARETLNRFRDTPTGRIRINAASDAVALLLAPVMPVFVDRYPDVELDIVASNRLVDIVASGFDAGIRYGGTIPEDMIARRLSPDMRWVVAASPAYLRHFGTPATPADLADHRCLGVRLGDDRLYRWEFRGPDGEFDIATPNPITLDDSRSMLIMAINGTGLMFGPEALFKPALADGSLTLVLENYATTGPGFSIYFPSRRQLPTGLRVLIDLIKEIDPLNA
ncbi:LysR family transcriptional regulator [Altericroceibacterium spongiae]|uniref:LysR family transcriptional regulator n=1 Tax=Altericroceibacterium spongiae TaxID=2320269 RepID=A0A420ERL7_9SPHN|nr:LysR family transcriptional regulator [Altericroceibacterium spongiae]RKF23317.1 LysR family transcriptional regulator [Altericroceibacterium spongiae]